MNLTPIQVAHKGLCIYQDTLDAMKNYTLCRTEASLDQLWFLEHPPVFTQGQAGKKEHILNPHHIPVIQSDRGGQVTYHAPGQLIIYFLCNLHQKKITLRQFIDAIELSIIQLLAHYHLKAHTIVHAPGVYIDQQKICSIGLRIRKGCTYHGISLNVNMDITPFNYINPCGYKELTMINISDFIKDICITDIIKQLKPILLQNLQWVAT